MATIVVRGLYHYSTGNSVNQHMNNYEGTLQETSVKCSDKTKNHTCISGQWLQILVEPVVALFRL